MPQADPIVRADEVQLVNADFATPKRREVAEYIQENWNRDITLTEIAQELDYSRQHVANVLKQHFEIADDQTMESDRSRKPAVPNRDDIDPELLSVVLNAYRIGVRDASSDDIDEGISDELLELATTE